MLDNPDVRRSYNLLSPPTAVASTTIWHFKLCLHHELYGAYQEDQNKNGEEVVVHFFAELQWAVRAIFLGWIHFSRHHAVKNV